jgi:predicted AlkP superfamily phosphohydrolase/phosphomutase
MRAAVTNVDWHATRVYPTARPDALRVNLRGRESHGIVAADEFAATCATAQVALLDLRDPADGGAIVRAVRVASEGSDGADLVLETDAGYRARRGIGSAVVVPPADAVPGVVVVAGAGARRGAALGALCARDVAATMLRLLGITPPADLAGTVATAALATGHLQPAIDDRSPTTDAHEALGYP